MKKLEVKLKPKKGKKFRVLLCDDQGNVVYDDVDARARIGLTAKQLIPTLMEKQEHGEAIPEEKD